MPIPPPAPRAPRWRKGAGRMLLFLAAVAGHAEGAAHGITTGETLLGLTAEGWVYVSLTIFIVGIFWFGRAHHRLRDALDARTPHTRSAERRDGEASVS